MNRDRIWTLMSRKLSGEATQAELLELDNLISMHPDTDIPVQYISEFWSIPAESDNEFLEATYHLHSKRLKQKGFDLEINKQETGSLNLDFSIENKRKKRLLWACAAAVFTAVIAFLALSYHTTPASIQDKIAQSEVSTKNGSRTKIQLPDGTSVWLNSSSKLVYDNQHFGTSIRDVSLVGEAYFDVVKNPAKPFIIHTAKMDIRVLGTAFDVKCYPDEKTTETSLIRGSIEVTLKDRQEKIMMKPNEKLILSNEDLKPLKINTVPVKQAAPFKANPIIELGHLTLFPKDSSIVETAWVENKLLFSDESLGEIAKKMERWYGVSIQITSERLKKELITGAFEKETIYQALNALQLTIPFTYKANKDIIIISN